MVMPALGALLLAQGGARIVLVPLCVITTVPAFVLYGRHRRTDAGDQRLAQQRERHAALASYVRSEHDDGTVAASLALGFVLFGSSALSGSPVQAIVATYAALESPGNGGCGCCGGCGGCGG
jgi:uncharacterized protein (TIGR04222 family)